MTLIGESCSPPDVQVSCWDHQPTTDLLISEQLLFRQLFLALQMHARLACNCFAPCPDLHWQWNSQSVSSTGDLNDEVDVELHHTMFYCCFSAAQLCQLGLCTVHACCNVINSPVPMHFETHKVQTYQVGFIHHYVRQSAT
jgi:hypothetical protein